MNSKALKAKMVLLGIVVDALLEKLEEKGVKMSRETFYRKIKGTSEFNRKEILSLSEILKLTNNEIMDIFFIE